MKLITWLKDNYLLALTLFLLAFIPLYPKLPLVDIKHTWVYIRLEDFLIAASWIVFFISYFRKKATLTTPLTLPIFVFWLVGALATIHGVLFIFPKLEGVFPNLAFLNFLRRVEYMSLFFLGFAAIKNKNTINPIIATLSATLLVAFVYGLGQRLWGFPAFLTMNEEFAKGIPLRLSPLARIPSTFAGHYDLAAYLILLIPIMGSMIFGYKKWYLKIIFFLTATSGLILLLLTASRVSFVVYMVSIAFMLVFQKQKKFIIPVFIFSIFLLQSFTGISSRFAQTFTQVDLVVDARSGKAIGVASEIGDNKQIIIEEKQSTGENLPTGSKYINIPSVTGEQFTSHIIYKKLKPNSNEEQIISKTGQVVVKKAFAYDVSFTTRFQGEWPRAFEAFKRNIFLGSGYSSINLATDNSFLRMLGETGLLGLLSFIFIFVFIGIYLFRLLPEIDDKRIQSLVIGVLSGSFGLAVNATLIDVYEASKVAFVLWALIGLTLGLARLYQKKKIDYLADTKRIFTSVPAVLVAFFIVGFLIFSPSLSHYFVGDDFTWLRWAADCSQLLKETGLKTCSSFIPIIFNFFTNSEGFFYRPGTKTYFYLAYPIIELFPMPFHVVSLLLHITATAFVYFIGRKLLQHNFLSFLAAIFFLILSVHAEAVYWISVTGHLITTNLLLIAFLSFLYWRETKRTLFFVVSLLAVFVSLFFHEFGTTGPLLLIAVDALYDRQILLRKPLRKWYYLLLLLPLFVYFVLRTSAHSVWFHGDYRYNLIRLPFNVFGNAVGYFILSIVGPIFLPIYTTIRRTSAENLFETAVIFLVILGVSVVVFRILRKSIQNDTFHTLSVFFLLFIIPLLPFLGLGNISPRYAYMSSVGVVLFLTYLLKTVVTKQSGRNIVSMIGVTVFSVLFMFIHIKQLHKTQGDWKKAGEIVNDTLVSINYAYAKEGALSSSPVFYFINVPIKYGDAWVFPVGLRDALWFSFQNIPLQVITTSSEEESLLHAKQNSNVKVFKFEKDYSISEVHLPASIPRNYGK